ncbi:hypothetical protein NL676_017112 [Syzygium grande]|nr:hypothetical protein NL676_017112 [Syzygium grande]
MERGNDAWKINGNNTKDHYTTGLEKEKLYLLSGPIHCTSPQAQSRTKRRHGGLESLKQIWEGDTDQVRVRDVTPQPKPYLAIFFSRGSGRPGNLRVRSRLPKAKRNYGGDLSPNSEADDIESETVISSIPREENSSQTWVPSVFTSEIDITVVGVGHKTIVDEASA